MHCSLTQQYNWFVFLFSLSFPSLTRSFSIWMDKVEELELPEFTAVVQKTLNGHQFPLPPLPWKAAA